MLSRIVAGKSIDIHVSRFIVARSFAAAAPSSNSNPKAAAKSTADKPVQTKSSDRVREYLAGLRASAGQDQILKLSKLYHLIDLCNKPEHDDIVISGVNFFQHKGQDFNSEIASKLIATSIKYEFPIKVGKLFSKYEHRIGAWVDANELDTFLNKIVEEGKNFPLSGNILINASKKGVKVLKSSYEVVFPGLASLDDEKAVTIHNKLLDAAKLVLKSEEYAEILAKFPAKTSTPTKSE